MFEYELIFSFPLAARVLNRQDLTMKLVPAGHFETVKNLRVLELGYGRSESTMVETKDRRAKVEVIRYKRFFVFFSEKFVLTSPS